jgi:hypothetical protein
MLGSNAYRGLSPNARSLLVELASLHNGANNGSLYLGVRDAAHRMGVADLTAANRAFGELTTLGFIEMTQEGHFAVKAADASRARCWRLTWEPAPRKAPSWDFEQREPDPQTPAHRRMERGLRVLKTYRKARDGGKLPVLESDTLDQFRPAVQHGAVLQSDTPNDGNGSYLPSGPVRDSATHLAIPWGEGAQRPPIGWWQPDWVAQLAALNLAAMMSNSEWSAVA